MKRFLLAAVAVVGLGLVGTAQASAHWETRTAYRYDPACGRSVAVSERYWIPDYETRIIVYRPAYHVEGYRHHDEHHQRGHHDRR